MKILFSKDYTMKRITLFLLSFFLTIGMMAATTDLKVTYKAEVEGWTSANPNTHFGGITFGIKIILKGHGIKKVGVIIGAMITTDSGT